MNSKNKVLVIEDQNTLFPLVSPMFEGAVKNTSTVEDGLLYYRKHANTLDLVLFNMTSLDNQNTLYAIQQLKHHNIFPEILLINQGFDPQTLVRLVQEGVFDILSSPPSEGLFKVIVRKALEHQDPIPKCHRLRRTTSNIDLIHRLTLFLSTIKKTHGSTLSAYQLKTLLPAPTQTFSIEKNQAEISSLNNLFLSEKTDTITVLIVEDLEELRSAIKRKLLKRHYNVIEADSAESAINTLKKTTPDLIILDIGLPSETGDALVSQLNTLSKQSRVIMHTAYTDIDLIPMCLNAGADAFLLKPTQDDILFKTLEFAALKKWYQEK